MGKASRKKKLRSAAQAEPVQLDIDPPDDSPFSSWTQWAMWLAALLVLAGVGLSLAQWEATRAHALLPWGLGLATLSASCSVIASLKERSGHLSPLWLWGCASFSGLLALMAMMARDPALHASPFAPWHMHFVGVPSELAYVALASSALVLRTRPSRRLAWWTFAGSSLWVGATLLMPHFWLGELKLPLFAALDKALLTPSLLALPFASALACVICALRARPLTRSWPQCPQALFLGAASGALILSLYHLLAPIAGESSSSMMLGVGLTLGGLTLSLTLVAAQALEREHETLSFLDNPALDRWGCALLLSLYALLKIHGMGPSNTDENIYFYMAEALSRGEWPYIDYFFAHPPLHVVLPGLVMSLTGFSFTLAKSFSVLASAVTGFAIWSIGKDHLGRLAGLCALGAFLFAAETLKASTNMTGINLTTMWLILGLWQSLSGRAWLAGALFGVAACTGFYSMGAICALLLIGVFHSRGFAWRQIAGFVVVAGAINALFYMVAGEAYLDGVYRYHGLKATREAAMLPLFASGTNPLSALLHNIGVMVDGRPFTRDVFYHSHLWLAGLVAPLLGAASWFSQRSVSTPPLSFFDPRRFHRDGQHGVIAVLWLVSLALFVQYAMFRELYSFYFVLIYPTLALCLGWGIWHSVTLLGRCLEAGARGPHPKIGAAISVLGLAALCLWPAWSADANKAFPSEQKGVGTKHEYTWRDAPLALPLSDVAKTLFWEGHRLRGNMERGYRHYLWTKKREFSKAEEIAAWINAESKPDETIAGASGAAPLIALLSERRLAAGESDTNSKRFKAARVLAKQGEELSQDTTRLVDDATYWNAICADNVRFLISTSRSYFTSKKLKSLATARRWFKVRKTFWDDELKYKRRFPITIFERIGSPPNAEQVCRWE